MAGDISRRNTGEMKFSFGGEDAAKRAESAQLTTIKKNLKNI